MLRNFRVRPPRATPAPAPFLGGRTQPGSQRRRGSVGALAALGVLIPAFLSVGVQPAAAGELCDRTGVCGAVINNSDRPMLIAEFSGSETCVRDSGESLSCTTTTLPAGRGAGGGRGYFKDVDGLAFASSGFYYVGTAVGEYYVAPNRYLKITDNMTLTCTQPGPVATPRCMPVPR